VCCSPPRPRRRRHGPRPRHGSGGSDRIHRRDHLCARAIGTPVVLDDAEMAGVAAAFSTYGRANRRRYLTRDTAQAVAIGIAKATFAARQQSLWGEGRPLSRPTRRTFGPMTRTFSSNGTLATAGAGS